MQKHVNLVDLVKSFPTNIYLQNLASIQKRTSPVKFAHFAEKSGKGSISNLSTKVFVACRHSENPSEFCGAGGEWQSADTEVGLARLYTFAALDAATIVFALVERFDIELFPDFSAK